LLVWYAAAGKVYATVRFPSVCLSVQSIARCMSLRRVCYWGSGRQDISIDSGGRLAPSGTAAAVAWRSSARRSAANASSVTLSVDVGSWTQTCISFLPTFCFYHASSTTMPARPMLSSSICPSVYPSVTQRHCVKTRRLTQIKPQDRPGTSVFWRRWSFWNSTRVTQTWVRNAAVGYFNVGITLATFDE